MHIHTFLAFLGSVLLFGFIDACRNNDDIIVEFVQAYLDLEAGVGQFLWDWFDVWHEDFDHAMWYWHLLITMAVMVGCVWLAVDCEQIGQVCVYDTWTAICIDVRDFLRQMSSSARSFLDSSMPLHMTTTTTTTLAILDPCFVPGAFPDESTETWDLRDVDEAAVAMSIAVQPGLFEETVAINVDIARQQQEWADESARLNAELAKANNALAREQDRVATLKKALEREMAALVLANKEPREIRMTIPARRKMEAERDRLRDEVLALKGQKASVENKSEEVENERDELLRKNQELQTLLETANAPAAAAQKNEPEQNQTGSQTDLVQVEDQPAAVANVEELQKWQQWFGDLRCAYEATKETLGRCDQARQTAAEERDAALSQAVNQQNDANEVVRALTQENNVLKESISQVQTQADCEGPECGITAYKAAFETAEAKSNAVQHELRQLRHMFEVYKLNEVSAIKRELAQYKNEYNKYFTMYDKTHKQVQDLEKKVDGLEGIEAKYEEANLKAKKYEKAARGEAHYRERHDEMVKKLGDVEAGKRWMEQQAKEHIRKLKDELDQLRSEGRAAANGMQDNRMRSSPSPTPSWLRDESPSPASSTPGRTSSASGGDGGRSPADRDRAGMLRTIRDLATDKATLSKEVKGLKAANEGLDGEIGRLRIENAGLLNKVDELEMEVDVWKQTNDVDLEKQKQEALDNEQLLCWKQAQVDAAKGRADMVAVMHNAAQLQGLHLESETSPRKNKRVASEQLGGTVKKVLCEEKEEEEEEISEEE
ncbi:hypothetical protein RBB50_008363 [Rhinocladiella similis]